VLDHNPTHTSPSVCCCDSSLRATAAGTSALPRRCAQMPVPLVPFPLMLHLAHSQTLKAAPNVSQWITALTLMHDASSSLDLQHASPCCSISGTAAPFIWQSLRQEGDEDKQEWQQEHGQHIVRSKPRVLSFAILPAGSAQMSPSCQHAQQG
jgi:hypothetical protein